MPPHHQFMPPRPPVNKKLPAWLRQELDKSLKTMNEDEESVDMENSEAQASAASKMEAREAESDEELPQVDGEERRRLVDDDPDHLDDDDVNSDDERKVQRRSDSDEEEELFLDL